MQYACVGRACGCMGYAWTLTFQFQTYYSLFSKRQHHRYSTNFQWRELFEWEKSLERQLVDTVSTIQWNKNNSDICC